MLGRSKGYLFYLTDTEPRLPADLPDFTTSGARNSYGILNSILRLEYSTVQTNGDANDS